MKSFLTILGATAAVALSLALCVTAEESVKELQIETLKNGDCSRRAGKGDVLLMHYEGTLMSGKQFDSSYSRGEPFKITLGTGMVIAGWDKGLLKMCKGEVRNLVIPYNMAYGESGHPPVIPKKADLKFKVELLDFADNDEDNFDDDEEL